jgi:hypothetical protein
LVIGALAQPDNSAIAIAPPMMEDGLSHKRIRRRLLPDTGIAAHDLTARPVNGRATTICIFMTPLE